MSRTVLNPGFTHDGGGNNLKNAFDSLNTMLAEIYAFMAQPDNMQYAHYTDGTTEFRTGVRSGEWVLDQTITALGFAGSENTDWANIRTEKLP